MRMKIKMTKTVKNLMVFHLIVALVTFQYHVVIAAKENSVILDFVGDINLGGPVQYQHVHGYCSYNKTFEHVSKFLRESDLAIGNLEAPFIREDMEQDEQKQFTPRLRAEADSAEALRYAGFDIMCVANNHLNDFQARPVNYNLNVLKQVGIKAFGYTYGTIDEHRPQDPLIVEVKGIKIGFLGYCDVFFERMSYKKLHWTCVLRQGNLTAGPAIYSDQAATRDVQKLKKQVDVVAVAMHWGIEGKTFPEATQFQRFLHLKKLGVNLIIGCHPHTLQGHIIDKGTFASFSLGNFLFGPSGYGLEKFYYNRNPPAKVFSELISYVKTHQDPSLNSRILRVRINKKGFVSAEYLPLKITFHPESTSSRCLHVRPSRRHPRWIQVCSHEDQDCLINNDLITS